MSEITQADWEAAVDRLAGSTDRLHSSLDSAFQYDEFATVEEWEHDDQRELSSLFNHQPHDRPQFNRGQMRTAIRHGKRLAISRDLREQVARTLADRFIERGNARVTGAVHASWDDMPWSYRKDFFADADAVLAALATTPARNTSQIGAG